jgi:hypothetical protein
LFIHLSSPSLSLTVTGLSPQPPSLMIATAGLRYIL